MVVSSRNWPAEFVALVIETADQDSEENSRDRLKKLLDKKV